MENEIESKRVWQKPEIIDLDIDLTTGGNGNNNTEVEVLGAKSS